DHPRAALEARARLHVGEVRAGVGLRVALAPDLLAAQDRRQEATLLGVAPERDQRRPEQPLADVAEPAGPAGARVLLVPDHLLQERQLAAAQRARPAEPDPARRAEVPLPRAPLLDEGVLVAGAAPVAQRREGPRQVVGEPGAGLGAEGLVGVAEAKVHARSRASVGSGPL